jgi:hypothetical protein
MILKLKLFIYTYDFHRQLNQDYLDHYHGQQGVLTKGNISIESDFFFKLLLTWAKSIFSVQQPE